MVERALSMREVRGSIPCVSTQLLYAYFGLNMTHLSEKNLSQLQI